MEGMGSASALRCSLVVIVYVVPAVKYLFGLMGWEITG